MSETVVAEIPGAVSSAPAARRHAAWAVIVVIIMALISGGATVLGMRHQSTTFDEILMPSAGARGYETGRFDLVLDHPPVAQYLYGLPVYLSGPDYPDESGFRYSYPTRYPYAQEFFWRAGNDPERIAFLARLMGVAISVALVFTIFVFTRRYWGDLAAVFAAGITAFLPDLLGHGGISYNDVPMALAFFGAVWALDIAVRRPSLGTAALAGVVSGIALGVKFSAIGLAPVGLLLVAAEALTRDDDRAPYLAHVAKHLPVFVAVLYLTTVGLYLGDFSLAEFRWGLSFNIIHAERGHGGVPAWLLGRAHPQGFWYFFPIALLLKTPAALHLLLALALLGFVGRKHGARWGIDSRLRAPILGGLVFLAFLMKANLNIGFRHALPLLPVLAVVGGVGAAYLWGRHTRLLRALLVALLVGQAASTLSAYPNFIAYTSEYVGDRDEGFTALVDSSLDWGQGLLQLRGFMREEGIETIYLSYFGSALPDGYGIDYVPLISFFRLHERPAPAEPPRFLAISATNLTGSYVGDSFAHFRSVEPYRVLGHSIFVFELED